MEDNKEKRNVFLNFFNKFSFSIKNTRTTLEQTGPAFIWYSVALIIIMGVIGVTTFLAFNKGQERVLVPDVVGSNIIRASLILQEKELYPRVQLRYADRPGQAGLIIDQSPKAGSVVKASSRITVIVSRGIVFDHVGNYVGTNIDTLKTTLDAFYAGTEIPSLTIGLPIFTQSKLPVGTILNQDPPAGTPITQPINLKLIVSSGSENLKVEIPNLKGKTIDEVLQIVSTTNLTFDFTEHIATNSETAGTVVKQINPHNKNSAVEFSRVKVEFALPAKTSESAESEQKALDIQNKTEDEAASDLEKRDTTNYVHGIYSTTIPEYPYAVPVHLDVIPQEGSRYTLVTLNHIGGALSLPYAVPHGSVLVLNVLEREVERVSLQ